MSWIKMPLTTFYRGKKRIKILIAPVEIAGYYTQLAQGFTENGINVRLVQRNKHKFNYSNQIEQPKLVELSQLFRQKRENYSTRSIKHFILGLVAEFFWIIWAVIAIIQYNSFVFGFGQSLLPRNIDLPILKMLRKTVIANLAHGSEARPPYFDGTWQALDASNKVDALTLFKYTKKKYELIQRIEQNCTFVIGGVYSTSPFANKKFINTNMLGIPFSQPQMFSKAEEATEDVKHYFSGSGIKILHSPSNRQAKGSDVISQSIKELQAEGISIDFLELSGVTNQRILEAIQECDLVIDQIYSDAPLTGFVTEAAYFGKPSIVAGYDLDQLNLHTPFDLSALSFICKPHEIKMQIRACIAVPHEVKEMGLRAQAFIVNNWDTKSVALRYVDLLSNKVPTNWWIDPERIIYTAGCGQELKITARNVRGLVHHFGYSALMLDKKPILLRATLEMARFNAHTES